MATMQLALFGLSLDEQRPFDAPETFYLGRCPRCHRHHRATADHTKLYGAARYVPCTRCNTSSNATPVLVPVLPIKATYHAGTPCDSRCLSATGHHCECSCNGRNHGRMA